MKHYKNNSRLSNAHFNMIVAVISFLLDSANVAITSSIAMLFTIVNRIKDNITAINNLRAVAVNPITGYAAQKEATRKSCTEIGLAIMKSTFTFAQETGNDILRNQMDTTRSKINRIDQDAFAPFMQNAYNKAFEFKNELEDYGVTPEEFELWQQSITLYSSIVSSPVNQKNIRNQAKREIQSLLKASMLMLYNQVDQLVEQLKESHPAYYQQYFMNRKIINHVNHTRFRVVVKNELDEPIYGVVIRQNDSTRSASTNMQGEAILNVQVEKDPAVQPVYSFTITSGEQVINTGNIMIKRGHIVTRTYVMQPSGFILPSPVSETTEPIIA